MPLLFTERDAPPKSTTCPVGSAGGGLSHALGILDHKNTAAGAVWPIPWGPPAAATWAGRPFRAVPAALQLAGCIQRGSLAGLKVLKAQLNV